MVPIGLGAGRIGNFINRELPGRPVESDIPWALDFGDHIARHPSSLYQAVTEGLLLFIILWMVSVKNSVTHDGKCGFYDWLWLFQVYH